MCLNKPWVESSTRGIGPTGVSWFLFEVICFILWSPLSIPLPRVLFPSFCPALSDGGFFKILFYFKVHCLGTLSFTSPLNPSSPFYTQDTSTWTSNGMQHPRCLLLEGDLGHYLDGVTVFFLVKSGPGVPSGATCLLHVGQTPSITFFPLPSSSETISSSSPAVISHMAWFPNLPQLQPSFTGWLLIRIFPPSTNLCSWLQPHPPDPQEKQDCEPHWAGLRFSFICAER